MADVKPVQVEKFLSGIDYPAKKDELVSQARDNGASNEVRQTLERLPEKTYNSPNDVSEEIGRFE